MEVGDRLRTCASCGRDGLEATALLCPQCGRVLDDERSAAASRSSTPSVAAASDPGATQSATYPCGHATEHGAARCRFCDTGTPGRSVGVDTPWGLLALGEAPLFLGRDPDFSPHAVELARWDNVSRRHVVLRQADGGVIVEDLYSANGTFIGELRLGSGERQLVPPGTEIKLGSDPPVVLRIVEA